eukprot:2979818-Rhodomonas_salina.2
MAALVVWHVDDVTNAVHESGVALAHEAARSVDARSVSVAVVGAQSALVYIHAIFLKATAHPWRSAVHQQVLRDGCRPPG